MKSFTLLFFISLSALSGCASNGNSPVQKVSYTGSGALVIKPIGFNQDAFVREAVKQECDLDGKLTQFIREYAANRYASILTDAAQAPADAQILTVEIQDVEGAAGGAWSGPKVVMIKGSLSQNGKELGDFKARRYSGGGMFGAYKGTCAILVRCVKALGRDVAEWLDNPTAKASLGDL